MHGTRAVFLTQHTFAAHPSLLLRLTHTMPPYPSFVFSSTRVPPKDVPLTMRVGHTACVVVVAALVGLAWASWGLGTNAASQALTTEGSNKSLCQFGCGPVMPSVPQAQKSKRAACADNWASGAKVEKGSLRKSRKGQPALIIVPQAQKLKRAACADNCAPEAKVEKGSLR
eukprot:1160728-Pelagomonas_calceolata.AAC.5